MMLPELLSLSLLFPLALGECPSLDEIPLMMGDAFTCARVYMGYGSEDAIRACNACPSGGGEIIRVSTSYEYEYYFSELGLMQHNATVLHLIYLFGKNSLFLPLIDCG